MEKKRIMVSMLGIQTDRDGDQQEIHMLTEGDFYSRDDEWVLEFDEADEQGADQVHTLISISDDEVTLSRTGAHQVHFIFRTGQKFINNYIIEQGSMEMAVYPLLVDAAVTESGGAVDLKYQLDIAGQYASLNRLTLTFSENVNRVL